MSRVSEAKAKLSVLGAERALSLPAGESSAAAREGSSKEGGVNGGASSFPKRKLREAAERLGRRSANE